jgi:hypothetical protein
MRKLICLFILIAAACTAADFSGRWTGTADTISPDGNAQHFAVYLQLHQSGNELTGEIGASPDSKAEIAKGKVEGNTVTFEVQQGDNGPLWKIKLTGSGDQLNGEASGVAGTQTLKGHLALKRNAAS